MKSLLVGIALIAVVATMPAHGQAQEISPASEQPTLEDIVVTAQRRGQTLQDVPVSVSVFSSEFLQKSRIQTVADLVAFTPGVNGTNVAQTTPRITVRGVSTEDFGVGSDPALGIYVDDVYLGRGVSSVTDLFDIERVEILKGPQGTLFGRNTTAGAISIVTAKPSNEFEGFIDAAYGRFDQFDLRGAVNLPLGGDLGLRIAGSSRVRDGFVDNTLGGRIGALNSQAVRATLGYSGADTRATLGIEYRNARNQPGPYINPLLVGTDPFGLVSSDLVDGASDEPRDDLDAYRVTLRITHDLTEDLTLTSITAYNGFSNNAYLEDTDASPLLLLHFGTEGSQDSYSQELRLNGESGRLTWFIGANASRDIIRSTQFALFSEEDTCSILFSSSCTAALGAPGEPRVREESVASSRNESYSVFGDATFAVSDRFDVIAGLRFSRDLKDFRVRFPANSNLLGPIVVVPPSAADLATFGTIEADGTLRQRYRSSSWQPRFALRYELTDRIAAYASATRGYKAGGFNQLAPGPGFAPEQIWSYEAGLKGEALNRRLRFDLSGYYFDYDDLQVLLNFAGSVVTRNAATARGRGVEASVTALPVTGVTMSAGATYQDVTYGRFVPNATDDFSGNRLVRAPEVSLSGVIDVDIPVREGLNALARIEASYRSRQFFDPSNTAFESQPGFALFNASLGVGLGQAITLRGFVQNVFDQQYLVDTAVTVPGLLAYTQRGEPRTYGLQFSGRF